MAKCSMVETAILSANFYSPSQLIISISNLQWQIVTWNTQQNWHSKSDDCCSDICSLNQHKYLEGKSSSPNQHKYLEGKLCSPFSLTKLQGKLCNTSILILIVMMLSILIKLWNVGKKYLIFQQQYHHLIFSLSFWQLPNAIIYWQKCVRFLFLKKSSYLLALDCIKKSSFPKKICLP